MRTGWVSLVFGVFCSLKVNRLNEIHFFTFTESKKGPDIVQSESTRHIYFIYCQARGRKQRWFSCRIMFNNFSGPTEIWILQKMGEKWQPVYSHFVLSSAQEQCEQLENLFFCSYFTLELWTEICSVCFGLWISTNASFEQLEQKIKCVATPTTPAYSTNFKTVWLYITHICRSFP